MAKSEKLVETFDDLHAKLAQIQIDIKAPKTQFNKFGNYSHRNIEDILEAFKKVSRGTYLVLSDEIVELGQRVYVKSTATISDGKDTISACAYAREALQKKGIDDSQVTGSTSSYARKYALGGLLGVDDNKDADTMDNSKAAPHKKSPPYMPTYDNAAKLKALNEDKKTEFKQKIQKCDDANKLGAIYKNILSIFGPYRDTPEINDFLMDVVDLCKTRKKELEGEV